MLGHYNIVALFGAASRGKSLKVLIFLLTGFNTLKHHLTVMALPVFLVPDRAWHATPRHVSPGHRARHVKTKTGHGVARVKISAPRVARHVPRRATFTRKRGVAWHGTPCHVPRRAMFSSAVFELQNYKFNAAQ